MTTVNDIVRETIRSLNAKKIPLTPDNYGEMFCKIARKRGFNFSDCNKVSRYMSKLNSFLREDITKYDVNSSNDLFVYLIASLNRLTAQEKNRQNLILITLLKRVLQSISVLHNKEATKLANASLERIEHLTDINTFEIIKDKWFDFLTKYDDKLLQRLSDYTKVYDHDLELTIDEILKSFEELKGDKTIKNLTSAVISSLTPSLVDSLDDEIATLSYELKNSPSLVNRKDIQQKIEHLVKKRVLLDKKEVRNRILSLDELLGEVSQKIVTLIDNSSLSRDRIISIKKELQNFDEESLNFYTIQQKLIKIAESLELESDILSKKMAEDDKVVKTLQLKIKKLESALSIAKKESKKDFLTSLSSRKVLDEELNRVHKSFIRYNISYSICFFDLDFFKKINDTYGHDAGDLVLKKMGSIFLKLKRDVDMVGRYGGEEFLAILPNTPLKGALFFAQKIRKNVEASNFIYKDKKVDVTISVGVATSSKSKSLEDVIKEADEMLYKAKNGGRNQVMPKI